MSKRKRNHGWLLALVPWTLVAVAVLYLLQRGAAAVTTTTTTTTTSDGMGGSPVIMFQPGYRQPKSPQF